jgi:2,4-dienoyl-CoA reductase-like NADH-dependent reductase (Old Yellow Enzyme family)
MRKKLFTPLNVGAFDLQHRLVMEWPQSIDPLDVAKNPFVPPSDPHLAGGLVIYDPGPLIWPGPVPLTPSETDRIRSAWRNVIENARLSYQSVLARLRADLSFQIAADPLRDTLALKHDDIGDIIGGYVDAAHRAKSSGFDGVELDSSFGSVTDLFLRPSSNLRSYRYGPVVQRSDFVIELVEALTQAFGRERVGIRLSPFEASVRSNIYDEILRCLCDQEIAYIHLELTEQFAAQALRSSPSAITLREAYPGIFIASCEQGLHFAMELVGSRWADAVCFPASQIDGQFLGQLRQEGFDGTEM